MAEIEAKKKEKEVSGVGGGFTGGVDRDAVVGSKCGSIQRRYTT